MKRNLRIAVYCLCYVVMVGGIAAPIIMVLAGYPFEQIRLVATASLGLMLGGWLIQRSMEMSDAKTRERLAHEKTNQRVLAAIDALDD